MSLAFQSLNAAMPKILRGLGYAACVGALTYVAALLNYIDISELGPVWVTMLGFVFNAIRELAKHYSADKIAEVARQLASDTTPQK